MGGACCCHGRGKKCIEGIGQNRPGQKDDIKLGRI
jgi:hypothetical protein